MISGVCKFCGSTAERACPRNTAHGPPGEPCTWIDQEETLCSACLPCLTSEELGQLWLEEFLPRAEGMLPPVHFDGLTAYAVVAALQLALKHPQIQEHLGAGLAVRHVADALAEILSQAGPLTAETLRRGFAGCYQPDERGAGNSERGAQPAESLIIVP